MKPRMTSEAKGDRFDGSILKKLLSTICSQCRSGTLSRLSSALVPEMARCRAFSEYSGSCCGPDRDPDWPMLPVSSDSPGNDSLLPCGEPKQRFPGSLDAAPKFDTALPA